MSRAQNVYVVFDELGRLVGTFTVKHEMVSWVRHRDGPADVHHWQVWRYPDNPGYGSAYRRPALLAIEELLA